LENTGYGARGPMILNSIIADRRANFPDYPQTITSGAFDQFRPANIFRPNGFLNQIPGFGAYGSGVIGRIGGWLGLCRFLNEYICKLRNIITQIQFTI
jgi:hypothetical protein